MTVHGLLLRCAIMMTIQNVYYIVPLLNVMTQTNDNDNTATTANTNLSLRLQSGCYAGTYYQSSDDRRKHNELKFVDGDGLRLILR